MSSFGQLRASVYDRASKQQYYRDNYAGLSAYERHVKLVNHHLSYTSSAGAADPSLQERDGADAAVAAAAAAAASTRTDKDVLLETYRFVRTQEDDEDGSWEARLARKYYARLFKEYCIADLSRCERRRAGWRASRRAGGQAGAPAGGGRLLAAGGGCCLALLISLAPLRGACWKLQPRRSPSPPPPSASPQVQGVQGGHAVAHPEGGGVGQGPVPVRRQGLRQPRRAVQLRGQLRVQVGLAAGLAVTAAAVAAAAAAASSAGGLAPAASTSCCCCCLGPAGGWR
jgi:hypothetical protein